MFISVLGLGTIGLPTAEYIRDKGLKVFGYDKNKRRLGGLSYKEYLPFSNGKRSLKEVYVICVSTWNANGKSDLGPLLLISRRKFHPELTKTIWFLLRVQSFPELQEGSTIQFFAKMLSWYMFHTDIGLRICKAWSQTA